MESEVTTPPSCEEVFREYLTTLELAQEKLVTLRARETQLLRKVHQLRVENDRLRARLSPEPSFLFRLPGIF